VEARRALLEQCLQDAVHGGPPMLRSAPPLLAFLHPAGGPSPPSEGSPWRSPLGGLLREAFSPAVLMLHCGAEAEFVQSVSTISVTLVSDARGQSAASRAAWHLRVNSPTLTLTLTLTLTPSV
jgi:hypothetical protein